MENCKKISFLYFSKLLKLIGSPIFYLITFCGVILVILIQLYNYFIHYLSGIFTFKSRLITPFRLLLSNSNKYLFLSVLLVVITALVTSAYTFFSSLPSPKLLLERLPAVSTKIYDRNGILLYKIYDQENRSLIKLTDLPPYVIHATIAAEDKNFLRHPGFSLTGIGRALKNNLSCSLSKQPCTSPLQGGSTITQQLVKNTLLSPEKSWQRKVKELYLAILTERMYSKEQILEMYLNNIPYGGTSYGIEEASQEYFGKNATNLTLGEAALLVGLPVAPTTLSPFGTTPYLAKIRQRQVLENMVFQGYLSENQKVEAENQTIVFHPRKTGILAPHFVMYIKSILVNKFGEQMVERGGLEVITSLDLSIQNSLQNEVISELDKLTKFSVNNGAGMVVIPSSGEILAMVGSRDFFDIEHDGQVNVPLMPRQPGSSIKPITYSLALLNGYKPDSLIIDEPICFVIPGSKSYCPVNYDGKFHGSVTLKSALANSYNIPAIKLLNTLGIDQMIALAQKMGITTWNDPGRYGLSLTLGGGEVTMYDMVQMYSVLANDGYKVPLNPLSSVKRNGVELLPQNQLSPMRVLPSQVATTISSILADPLARAPAFGYNSVLNLAGKGVSVKTGTTNNLRDNWTFGYSQDLLVATWVGNNDNSPMSKVASGITGASPIWARTMKLLLSRNSSQTAAVPIPAGSL